MYKERYIHEHGILLYILDGIYIYIFYRFETTRDCEILLGIIWQSIMRKSIRDKTVTLPSFLLFLRKVYECLTVGGFTPEGDNYSK